MRATATPEVRSSMCRCAVLLLAASATCALIGAWAGVWVLTAIGAVLAVVNSVACALIVFDRGHRTNTLEGPAA